MTASKLSSASAALLNGNAEPAVLVYADGRIAGCNLRAGKMPVFSGNHVDAQITALVRDANEQGAIATTTVVLIDNDKPVSLNITIIPNIEKNRDGVCALLLARDTTREHHLREALMESRQRYKELVEISSDFYWEVDRDGCFSFVTATGALGYSAEELVGQRPEKYIASSEDTQRLPFHSSVPVKEKDIWMRRSDGRLACVEVSSVPFLGDEDGAHAVAGNRGICRDVTHQRESEAAYSRVVHRERLMGYVVSSIHDVIDQEQTLDAAASATMGALGAKGCSVFRRTKDGALYLAAHMSAETSDDTVTVEPMAQQAVVDGIQLETQAHDHHLMITPAQFQKDINGCVAVWRDQPWDTDEKELAKRIAEQVGLAIEQIVNHEHIVALSRTDGLTGLLNRRAFFEEELPRYIDRLLRDGQTAALIYADLDNFKQVNDVHGHQRGDEALLALRDLLHSHVRPGDAIARLGGDEFALWLNGITSDTACDRAQALIDRSLILRKFSGSEDKPLGLSLGVAVFDPTTEETLEELVLRADEAMYEVKRRGKGSFTIAPPAIVQSKAKGNKDG